jgi:hypothetical protein
VLHPAINPNELIDLIIAVIAMPLLLRVARLRTVPGVRPFVAGYLFWVLALVATIAEGFALPDALNMTEHLCYTAAGISFLIGALGALRSTTMRSPEQS